MSNGKESSPSESHIADAQTGKPLPAAWPTSTDTDQNPAFLIDDGLDDTFGPIDLKAAGDADRATKARRQFETSTANAEAIDRRNGFKPFGDLDWARLGTCIRAPDAAEVAGIGFDAESEGILVLVRRTPEGGVVRTMFAGPASHVSSVLATQAAMLIDHADMLRMSVASHGWRRL